MPTLNDIERELRSIQADLSENSLVKKVRDLNDILIDLQHAFKYDDLVSDRTSHKFDKVVQDIGEVLADVEQDTLIDFGIW